MIDPHNFPIPYGPGTIPLAAIARFRVHGRYFQARPSDKKLEAPILSRVGGEANQEGWITLYSWDTKAEAEAWRKEHPELVQ